MRRQLLPALRMLVAMTFLGGIAYTAAVTGTAQFLFEHRADGSLVEFDGQVVGSLLVGQTFAGPEFFQPRPSAVDYDPRASGATNYGPYNPDHLSAVEHRVSAYRRSNGLDPTAEVPVDAVTSSGSGLDPDISVTNARLQAARVSAERDLPLSQVLALIDAHTTRPALGFLSEPAVNVLALNLALEES